MVGKGLVQHKVHSKDEATGQFDSDIPVTVTGLWDATTGLIILVAACDWHEKKEF